MRGGTLWYLLGRGRDALVTFVLASVLAFIVMRVVPGDPARLIVGPLASPEALDNARASLGVGLPIWEQYAKYMSGLFSGDWGFAYSLGLDVRTAIMQRLPATLELAVYAFIVSIVGALLVSLMASYGHRIIRRIVDFICLISLGLPQFWLGLVLLLVFASATGILPGPTGRLSPGVTAPGTRTGFYALDALIDGQFGVFWDAVQHLILPVLSLAALPWAFLVRLLVANMSRTEEAPYVLVARSRGVSRWFAHVHHVLPNSLLATVSSSGLIFAQLITGSVLVETAFNWPGVGLLLTKGIASQDYSLVQTFILISAVVFILGNLVADLVNNVIDPRVRSAVGSGDAG